jgi:zinc/manganese transport system permease protein
MTLEMVDLGLLGPAFAAGLLILATHVPLGRQVLARGIVFLDLAVAQMAALGVIAAHFAGLESGWAVQLFAVATAVAGAVLLHLAERRWPQTQEALIGSVFVVAASLGILLLAHDPHGGEALHDLLAGQILWVGSQQLLVAAGFTAVLGALLLTPWGRSGTGFYLLFACAVTLSVQLAGVFLVFASLIVPALAVRRLSRARGLAAGWGIGMLGYAAGLMLSAVFDLPAGAIIVCALAAVAILFAFAGFMPLFKAGNERLRLK